MFCKRLAYRVILCLHTATAFCICHPAPWWTTTWKRQISMFTYLQRWWKVLDLPEAYQIVYCVACYMGFFAVYCLLPEVGNRSFQPLWNLRSSCISFILLHLFPITTIWSNWKEKTNNTTWKNNRNVITSDKVIPRVN